jgi:diaminohydroxyphosphoribosylaminopyrimidine deaminase / 5-amino-6-(5-phosphoribosylamino)uracil reductase
VSDPVFSAIDHAMMAQALRLAERAAYTTKPNPMVGCVLAHGEEVVGEGWHQRQGGPHAEVFALQAAGTRAQGATAYVTLEPCAHTGRTGPCADALIAAGVARVVAAMRDPFPQVDGAGFEKLRAAGIAVEHGLMEAQARRLNRGFLSRIERGRPWLRVKLATSLDGRSAMASGESKWISGDAARDDVHRWRARAGALLTGAGTVLADDPQLTVRFEDATEFVAPLRVVLDPGLATIARGRVREGGAPTLYLHAPDAKAPKGFSADHAAVAMRDGSLDLPSVLNLLAARGINEVQVEAGATLAGAFLSAGLVDELLLYVAPVLLGERARPLFDGLRIDAMAQRLAMRIVETRRVGDDVRLLLQPEPGNEPGTTPAASAEPSPELLAVAIEK